ncbi:TPA: hypothetical protein U2K59_003040 [Acinetobacter baumannii]|nr:hypothetical protein [Acinetobacter baumannii]
MTNFSHSNRRKFLALGTALAAGTLLSACRDKDHQQEVDSQQPLNDSNLLAQITAKMSIQLDDPNVANIVSPILLDSCFNWELPQIKANQINSIIGYAFGNRPNDQSGNTSSNGENQAAMPDPGPMNEALADTIYSIYKLNPVKIYAQWEIARFLTSKYHLAEDVLTSIEPIIASDGSIIYLSTDDVANTIIKISGGSSALGNVAIVGHRDHAKRCILTSQLRGIKAAVVQEVSLPVVYDEKSGQPWTRSRDLYLIHDIYAQLYTKTLLLTKQAYPQG